MTKTKTKTKSLNWRLLVIPAVLAMAAFGWWSNRGTTVADQLAVGDCFMMPGDDVAEFDRLDTDDCTEAHDGQIIAEVSIPGPSEYPGFSDPYWETVFEECFNRFEANGTRLDEVPPDAVIEFFTPVEAGWQQNDRESLCYIYSPSGLSGSFVAVPG